MCVRNANQTVHTFFVPYTHYITPLKARDLSTVSTSNAPRNMMSDSLTVDRDLRRLVINSFMGFLLYSFMV